MTHDRIDTMSEESPQRDRTIVKIIRELCHEKGIELDGYSYDWIFSLKKNGLIKYIYGYRFDLNSTAAGYICQDKVATYQILNNAGIPAVPHTLVSSHQVYYDEVWKKDARSWQRFVLKPTSGAGGRNIYLFDDSDATNTFIHRHKKEVWSVSPFLSIVKETRLIVLDDTVLLAFEKHSPVIRHGIPMFNLRLGANAVNITPTKEYVTLALQAQKALGIRFGAVDVIELESGEIMVLEINDGFSLEHYATQANEHHDNARLVYSAAVDAMMQLEI